MADQAELLRRALRLAQTQEDLGPKYGPTLQENLRQLEALGACRTWEALRAHRLEGFGRLNAVRKPKDPELAERIKALRKSCWEGVKARQAPFAVDSHTLLGDLEQSHLALQGLVQLVREFAKAYEGENAAAGCWILEIWSIRPWSCFWAGRRQVPPGPPGDWETVPGGDGGRIPGHQ